MKPRRKIPKVGDRIEIDTVLIGKLVGTVCHLTNEYIEVDLDEPRPKTDMEIRYPAVFRVDRYKWHVYKNGKNYRIIQYLEEIET